MWQTAILARTIGGAMGSVAVGFQFIDGVPVIEVHDPRWCNPVFKDSFTNKLKSLEIRYMRPEDVQVGGQWQEVNFWHRRIITETEDIIFEPAEVGDGAEPRWQVKTRAIHELGFCPVVWVQNLPVLDDTDGDPDCHGIYEMVEAIDSLVSQAYRGVLFNCFGQETSFITEHGVKSFSDYRDGDSVRVLSHSAQWRSATVRNFGKQDLYKITMRRGPQGAPISVRATRNHRWLLSDGTTTENIQVGDRLLSAPNKFSSFEYEISSALEKEWWCRGFVWGDGSTSKGKGDKVYGSRVRLCGVKNKYLKRFEENGFRKLSSPSLGGDSLLITDKYSKRLPNIDDLDINSLRAFVRGFVDADATKGHKKSTRWNRIQVTGDESIDFVRKAFPAVGLYLSGEVDLTGQVTNYGKRTVKTIRFSLNENQSVQDNSLWRVSSIEKDSTEDVWCLVVDEDKSFCLPFGIATQNCDPTPVVVEDLDIGEIRKGSDNAIKVTKGGDFFYAELKGDGPRTAREMAKELRDYALEVAQCVLDSSNTTKGQNNTTATEIEKRYSAMLAKADRFREQYGQRCFLPLMELMMQATRKLYEPRYDEDGQTIVRQYLKLPPKVSYRNNGEIIKEERRLGEGGIMTLQWPPYFKPSINDVEVSVRAASSAVAAKLIDKEHAIKFVSTFFDIEDVGELLQKLLRDEEEQQRKLIQEMMGAYNGDRR